MRGDFDTHTPFVVCDLPICASISTNDVPKTLFSSVDFPDDCGPMMATAEYCNPTEESGGVHAFANASDESRQNVPSPWIKGSGDDDDGDMTEG